MKIEYLTDLILTPVPKDYPARHLNKNSDKMCLWEDFIVEITVDGQPPIIITVPKFYVYDGASIPRVFHRLWHPFVTESLRASCVHDYIYSHLYYKFSKEFADNLLKNMIKRDNGSWFMQNTFYKAVRMNVWGGGWHD